MLTLISNPAQIITVDTKGENIKRGKSLGLINPVCGHHLLIENGIIKDFIPFKSIGKITPDHIIDASDKIILPGLIDCHTHTAFAGSRANEFKEKISGISYEEIAISGGGINSTVEAVRNTSLNGLIEIIKPRIDYFISQGVTSLEIKSGYGLDVESEIKILKAVNQLNKIYPVDIVPTFLGAHTFPKEFINRKDEYVSLIINEMLPEVAKDKLSSFCDGFCESTAFSANQIDEIFSEAKKLGFEVKLHTDQFNSIGGINIALKYNAVSVDHLEVINDSDIKTVSESSAVCVLLPGVSFFLNYGYAPSRKLISSNAIVALSTDYNPGSSNIQNLNLIMSLAAVKMGMTVEETISAFTINAAAALKLNNKTGSLEVGKQADISIFNTSDYADIVYNVGKNLNIMTIKKGKIIYKLEK